MRRSRTLWLYVGAVLSFCMAACNSTTHRGDEGTVLPDELDSFVAGFIEARLERDEAVARNKATAFLTREAVEEYDSAFGLSLSPLSNPHFSRCRILSREPLERAAWSVRVRVFEAYTGFGEIGSFDETLLVKREGSSYRIHGVDVGAYVDQGKF